MRILEFIFTFLVIAGVAAAQAPQQGKSYPDGHGGKVYFPLGDISFADEVVAFSKGSPAAAEKDSDPQQALGIPDYDATNDRNYLTLGCGGTLVLRFIDNALIDIGGPDLYVFEIGPAIEPTRLSISQDGRRWVEIGRISGGKAEVDIAPFVKKAEAYHYVKLADLKTACDGAYPGADIDAVGAIGSGVRISLSSAVLFDFGKFTLRPESKQELRKLAATLRQYPGATVLIQGHTDNIDSQEFNSSLSEKRADAVRRYLLAAAGLQNLTLKSQGFGEMRPVASNDTEAGRQKNRRVEIIVLPARTDTGAEQPRSSARDISGQWQTSWGIITLRQSSADVSGKYPEDNGEIFGKLTDEHVLEGYWIEDEAAQRCDRPLHGRYYWGRLRVVFSADFRSFTGTWGYCEAEPSRADFSGRKIAR